MNRIPLTQHPARPENGRSLKDKQHPGTLLRSRVSFAPHSARRASARPPRSMGVSGICKDPDALICVESTPTPFQVVRNLKKIGANMAKNLIGVSAPVVILPPAVSSPVVQVGRVDARKLLQNAAVSKGGVL